MDYMQWTCLSSDNGRGHGIRKEVGGYGIGKEVGGHGIGKEVGGYRIGKGGIVGLELLREGEKG